MFPLKTRILRLFLWPQSPPPEAPGPVDSASLTCTSESASTCCSWNHVSLLWYFCRSSFWMATFPGRPTQRRPVMKGRSARPTCPASGISTVSVSHLRRKPRIVHREMDNAVRSQRPHFVLEVPRPPKHSLSLPWRPQPEPGRAPHPMSPRLWLRGTWWKSYRSEGRLCQGCCLGLGRDVWDGVRGQEPKTATSQPLLPQHPCCGTWWVVSAEDFAAHPLEMCVLA